MSGLDICPACGTAVSAAARRCPRCDAALAPERDSRRERATRRAFAVLALLSAAGLALALTAILRERPRDLAASVAREIPGVITLVTYDDRNRTLSQGTGFVLTRDGLAASNFHVLEDAMRVDATLGDGRKLEVVGVRGFDEGRDLVVFQLGHARANRIERPSGLHALPLGMSARIGIGDRVAIISSPKGLSNTVSDGLVSAIRTDDGQRLIQITAPISPGSSGGPVFDAHGKVVGIATLQMSEGQNLNFATPIDSLRDLIALRDDLTLGEFRRRAKAHSRANDDFDRAFDAGLRHHNRGEYRTAVRWYLYSEVLDPEEPSSFYNAGLCYAELKERDRAAEQFYRYLAVADSDDPDRDDIEGWLEDNGFKVPKKPGK